MNSKIVSLLLAVLVLVTPARSVFAQAVAFDQLTPALPTSSERRVADLTSWATAIAVTVLDTSASLHAANRSRAFERQGARLGVVYGSAFLMKVLVHRTRPCAPSCGGDNPDFSFFSAHTALAFSGVGGPRLAVSLPLAVTTGGLRIAAGKHWLTDVITGAGVGALASTIR